VAVVVIPIIVYDLTKGQTIRPDAIDLLKAGISTIALVRRRGRKRVGSLHFIRTNYHR